MLRLAALISLLFLPACATIVKGTTQNVTVNTAPQGAKCTVDRTGARVSEIPSTPGTVLLQRNSSDVVVTCAKEGYGPASKTVSPSFNGATFGNILLGGLVGVIVDSSTGANYTYPDTVQVDMPAPVVALPATPPAEYVPGQPIRLMPVNPTPADAKAPASVPQS